MVGTGTKTITQVVIWLLAAVALSVGLLAVLSPGTAEARSTGPEYSYTRYAMERSATSSITKLRIPVYFREQPASQRSVDITNFERGSTAVSISVNGGGARGANGSFNIPRADFTFHNATQLWRAIVEIDLNSSSAHYSHYVLFRLSLDDTSGHIGYSGSFAQAAQEYGNWNAAGDDFVRSPVRSYSFDMATPCSYTSNTTQTISLYDLDSGNADNGGRTVTVTVRNLTTGQTIVSQTGGSGMGQGQTWSRDITFRPEHQYRVTLHDITANNMIRFNFPFDDANEYQECPTPGSIRPYTRVNGSAGATTYMNPSERADFIAFTRVSSYGGENHSVTARAERELNGNGTWTLIEQDAFTVTTNGDRTLWGEFPIGRGTTQGGNQRNPDLIPMNATQICYRARITASDGANVISNPSSPSCARIRGGQTSATSSVSATTIEPGSGDSVDFGGGMTTSSFRDWSDAGGDYDVECNWTLSGTTSAQLGGESTSGNCDQIISGNGTISVAERTYSPAASAAIGTRVCMRVTLTVSDFVPAANAESESCTTIAAKPYLKVAAGDIFAGKGFAPTTETCTATPTARIVSWNRGDVANNGQWRGAGTTYAAYATGTIDGFASSQFAPGATPTPYPNEPKGLTFANVASTGTWGGNYQGATCVPDYYGTKPTSATNYSGATWDASAWNTANTAASSPTNPDGTVAYAKTGNLTITGGTITAGSNILLYVQGNVYLSGNITANVPSIPPGSTNAVLETPGFLLVATGNIYVASGVSQLYGSFAAQPTNATTGGNFYTCASSNGTPLNLSATNYNACNTQLVITGGIAAKKVHLLRTYGSMSQDTNGGQPIGAAGSNGYQNAGEVIIYNPVLWLRRLTGTSGGSSGGTTYDAMTTLPPVL
jgi:hypothetical protein